MSQQEINKIIIDYLLPYEPVKIGLFGSRVRGDNRPDSDFDILIDVKKRISLFTFVKMEDELSDKLGVKVDLIPENSIKNERLKKYISQDLKIIFPC
ncbi:MAG: nucleotidyltransferase domain-containing protein [Bacteroidetes bacterium]|nr:nucleotidyltransferase domain-containing protein [Bacteroidota bacterium]